MSLQVGSGGLREFTHCRDMLEIIVEEERDRLVCDLTAKVVEELLC